ncbi:hypothetical protein F2P81_024247 [Scomber scombrus]|uniref:Uncharacterized protein n=1 Tax=Scomber scombrus TaxID=13677 RepID=A0AAV1NQU2_SCOSC
MAPAAGVSEALTVAPCRVALASALCQFHRAGGQGGVCGQQATGKLQGSTVRSRSPFWFNSQPNDPDVQHPSVILGPLSGISQPSPLKACSRLPQAEPNDFLLVFHANMKLIK